MTLFSRLLLPGLALLAGATVASARIERKVERQFTVPAEGSVELTTGAGNLVVEIGTGPTVHVTAIEKLRADTEAEADDLLRQVQLSIEQRGGVVAGVAKFDGGRTGGWSWGNSNPVQVDFVVSVPAGFSARLQTAGGAITVADLRGTVTAHTSGGRIELGKIGGQLEVSTSGGNITLASAAADARLRTSGGNITVGRLAGAAVLETSGGNITVGQAEATLRAVTSGGSVRVTFTVRLAGDCELRTSGGRIAVLVPKSAAFSLDAAASGGGVRADGLTITLAGGGPGKDHLNGDVNGGGPRLRLRTSGGSVDVRTS